jgi:hypothetical protein
VANTYVEFVARIAATPVARAYWGRRLFEVGIGLFANLMMEGAAQAVRLLWIRRDESPEDAVLLAGAESGLPIYPGESAATYKARVGDRWASWETTPHESQLNAQFAAAGFTGTTIVFQPGHPGPPPDLLVPYWSQFWVETPASTDAQLNQLRGIIARYKDAEWIFRGFILTGFTSQLFAIGEAAVGEDPVGG